MCQQCPVCNVPMTTHGNYMVCTTSSCDVKIVNRKVPVYAGDEQSMGDYIHVPTEFHLSHVKK